MRHTARLALLLALPATTLALAALPAYAGLRAAGPTNAATAHLASTPSRVRRVLAVAPGSTTPPTISGTPVPGATLTASTGTWNGDLPQTFTFRWEESDDNGATWRFGGNTATFLVPPGAAGRLFHVSVTALNASGAGTATSTVVTSTAPLVFRVAPTISGALEAGSTLMVTTGSWAGTPTTYSYAWARCDSTGHACLPISAGSNSYLVVPADVGSTLQATVTAGSASGTGTAFAVSGVVIVAAPADLSSPYILGRPIVGSTLTVSPGYWTGSLPQTVAYQWILLDFAGGVWSPSAVVGTGSTYTVPVADIGDRLEVEVTMTNAGGSHTAYTAMTAVVVGAIPINTALPTFSPSLLAGTTLTVQPGTWTGPATSLVYAWARCSRTGSACIALPPDGQGATHTLTYADVGHTLRATETAGNLLGTGSVSVLSGVVTTAPPHNDSSPQIAVVGAGPLQVGSKLTATAGGWSGALPDTYPFAWQSSPDGVTWTSLGVAGPAYTVPAKLAGLYIRVVVSVTNPAGTDTGYSNPSAMIAGPPDSTQLPRVNNLAPRIGTTLTGTAGGWVASPAVTHVAYQWQRSSTCAAWTDIAGATTLTYVVAQADAADCLRIRVTEINSLAPTGVAAASTPTQRVLTPPAMVTGPTIPLPSTIRLGTILTADPGSWTGSPQCDYSYRWQFSTDKTHWTVVDGADASRLILTKALLGGFVRVSVTAGNAAGNLTEFSQPQAT